MKATTALICVIAIIGVSYEGHVGGIKSKQIGVHWRTPSNLFDSPFNIVDYFMLTCPRKVPIDHVVLDDAEACLEKTLSEETVLQLVVAALGRKFQDFSSNACQMWPEVRTCIEGVITYLQSCHEQSYYGDVTEKLVEYACSETNGVSNLAEYLFGGGLSCSRTYKLRECLTMSLDQNVSFCTTVEKMRICAEPAFDACETRRPWKIVSQGLNHLYTNFNCTGTVPADN